MEISTKFIHGKIQKLYLLYFHENTIRKFIHHSVENSQYRNDALRPSTIFETQLWKSPQIRSWENSKAQHLNKYDEKICEQITKHVC